MGVVGGLRRRLRCAAGGCGGRRRGHAPWWLVVAGGSLGAAAHLANVAPDLEDDLATGVRGLPHRLGPRVSSVACALLLGGASILLVAGPEGAPTTAGWVVLGVAVPAVAVAALAGTSSFRRAAFPAIMLLTVLDVVLLVVGGAGLT
jgi:4-hydroxybenzoate polyprenyltransferase